MNNDELLSRAHRLTVEAMERVRPIVIHGIKLIATDRNIFKGNQLFEFENGWVIEGNTDRLYGKGGPNSIYHWLCHEVELRLGFLDPMELQAFRSPEVLEDEDPDEEDPWPIYLCDSCRRHF